MAKTVNEGFDTLIERLKPLALRVLLTKASTFLTEIITICVRIAICPIYVNNR